MSTAALETPTRMATDDARPARPGRVESRAEAPPELLAPRHRTLFAVPFRSAMTDADVQRLSAAAGLDCDLQPKLRGDTVSPGVRRSGLRIRAVPRARSERGRVAAGGTHVGRSRAGGRAPLAPVGGRRGACARSLGPDWQGVPMSTIDHAATLGGLVARDPSAGTLFEQLGIDYCCGGRPTLAEACAQRGLDAETVSRCNR